MIRRNRRYDPEKQRYWEEVVRRWKESGLSVRGVCRTEGLREAAFFFWRRELIRAEVLLARSRPWRHLDGASNKRREQSRRLLGYPESRWRAG